jgi:hypothetical protein
MRIRILALLGLGLFMVVQQSIAQKIDTSFFPKKEQMLIETYNSILSSKGAEHQKAELVFQDSLLNVLNTNGAFDYKFDSLKRIGRITSDDKKLVIFTWNIPHGMFHNYYGIIQYYSKKEKKVFTYSLKEEPGILSRSRQAQANISRWPGALYYKIVTSKYKGQVYYTVLGYNFNNLLSNYKLIEVIAFDEHNYPYFPQRKFMFKGKVQNRIILEFAEQANVSLDYDKHKKMIVFDHLSPARPSLEGQFQFYGPDFSFDGLHFEDGIWMHKSDIDISN